MRTYQHVLGDNLKRIRNAKGWRQDDLAREARVLGLDWKQATVAAMETDPRTSPGAKRRNLSLGSALLLQHIFREPGATDWDRSQRKRDANVLLRQARELLRKAESTEDLRRVLVPLRDSVRLIEHLLGDVTLADLLHTDDPDEPVEVDGAVVRGEILARLARGEAVLLEVSDQRSAVRSQVLRQEPQLAAIADLYGQPSDLDSLVEYMRRSVGNAEAKAASQLPGRRRPDRARFEVVVASLSLWNRTLTEQRDTLWRAQLEGSESPVERGRIERGHVTRQLIDELVEHVRNTRKGERSRTR